MSMKSSTLRTAGVIVMVFLLTMAVSLAQSSENVYKDKNGYFVAFTPAGWGKQDYPEETIRSKVAFNNPQINGVNIRVIAGPTPTEPYTLDDLLQENQQKIDTILKPRFPSGSFTIRKENIRGREGIVQLNSIPGTAEQKVVMFVNKNIWYSIAFSANSKSDYNKATAVFQRFLDSFIILDSGKRFTDAEIKAALVARCKRIAKLYIEMGQKGEALYWVNQGLAVDPDDVELKQMKQQLTGK
jgi:hypothetical protein